MIEKLAIGSLDDYTFGGGTVYGLTNFGSALTKTITDPTDGEWDGETLLTELLEMRQQSQNAYHYGPWMVYTAPNWDQYMDADFKDNSDITLRERLAKVNGFNGIQTLDYLSDYDIVLVQTTSDVIRMVVGMDITTLQWDSMGGLRKNFKVMGIIVPQLRADQNSNTGIVYGSTA